jgi:hypothetical protein
MPRLLLAPLAARLAALALAVAWPAEARIVRLETVRVEPAFGGASFSRAGAFERVVARAHGEVDPKAAGNALIQDIGLAPKNARGMVKYSADVEIIRPADPAKSNRVLLFDATERGNKRAVATFDADVRAAQPGLNGSADAGDGWLLRAGYTLVSFGWQADVLPGDARLTFQAR